MKYKKVCKEVNKIKSFAIGENKVLIGRPHEVIDFETNNVIMRSDVLFQELYSNNLMFWINDLYGKGYLLKKYYEVISVDEYIYTIKDQYIITSTKIGEERFTLIKNIENELESYKLYGSSTIYFVSSEKFFRKNFENNFIECFSFPQGEFLWQFDLTQLGKWNYDYEEKEERKKEVKQFVGAYNNILWIYLNSKEFIGLDIQSGELKYDITGVEKSNLIGNVDSYIDKENNFIFYDTEYILDGEKGKIIGLIADRFFEVDLQSENIEPKLFGL
ncbi:hypothetical protein [Paenimyroides aestuarii]|uniref:Uncharacterized protein n=1 Tax=Paenimyroides aestuarii TaxID=2968490 RepID=A0ABY5NPG4_9FLAO|nr:hypothetical protein [Paenimyroides aestuarii]UUV20438.1 hypothetical protein NPX36_08660 [Paenimyroides aestuarii]